jgi:hypothetical protein
MVSCPALPKTGLRRPGHPQALDVAPRIPQPPVFGNILPPSGRTTESASGSRSDRRRFRRFCTMRTESADFGRKSTHGRRPCRGFHRRLPCGIETLRGMAGSGLKPVYRILLCLKRSGWRPSRCRHRSGPERPPAFEGTRPPPAAAPGPPPRSR